MNKSPEDYFKEQNFSGEPGGNIDFSSAEKAFMDKYLGVDGKDMLAKLGIDGKAADAQPDLHAEMQREEPLEDLMRKEAELQMVGFFIGEQEFTIPTIAVQEVIRALPLAKLPAAPEFVAGVINLRGKVTPLVHLRDILEVTSPRLGEDKFIVVCRRHGFQLGMIIERVHTMYRVPQADIEWGIEAHIGSNVEYIAGLLKLNEKLVGIVSIDRIITSILK